jgi:apolipoprotein N-acyltransferase
MNFRSLLLAAFSGLLLAVAFPSLDLHLLAWIALLPLFLALRGQTVRNGFWLGGAAGIVYFAGTVYWVTNSVHFYGGVPIVPAMLITLLLCAYLALYPAVFGAAAVHIRKNHPSLFFIAAPALWTALELARTFVFSGFPWSLLGYSQYLALPVVQITDITGVYGVSFLIVLVNAGLTEFITDRKSYPGLIVVLFVMLFVLGYGSVKLRLPEQRAGIKVSVVQGNIEQDIKWDPAFQGKTLATYKQLTREALKEQPDLVIWPETATPFYFNGVATTD